MARLAMAAIGLERFRLRHDTWPDRLEEAADLIPGGLRPGALTGKPLTYRRLPYSGWELTADANRALKWTMPSAP